MKNVVGERGQVTIPKRIREALGIQPGDRVSFELKGSQVVLGLVDEDPFAPLIGLVAQGGDTDSAIDELRGPKPS